MRLLLVYKLFVFVYIFPLQVKLYLEKENELRTFTF